MPPNKTTESELQRAYIDARALGMTVEQAAKRAGYSRPRTDGPRAENSPYVKQELQAILSQRRRQRAFTREKVDEMVQRAFDVAEMQDDAGSMVRAISEINKMNGFYAAEEVKVDVSLGANRTKAAIQSMSTEELLAIAAQQDSEIIDGEYTEVDDGEDEEAN